MQGETITLGEGILNWPKFERQSGRYGSVNLTGPDGAGATWDDAPFGTEGTLTAEILETREAGHIGDFFRGVGPSTPEVGDRLTLGTGTLFTEKSYGTDHIGVNPGDDRESDWMDPRSLYRCHSQTVRLYFTPSE